MSSASTETNILPRSNPCPLAEKARAKSVNALPDALPTQFRSFTSDFNHVKYSSLLFEDFPKHLATAEARSRSN